MTQPPAEDTTADETPDERQKREHDEAEVRRKADAEAYETQRRQDRADADTRLETMRKSRQDR